MAPINKSKAGYLVQIVFIFALVHQNLCQDNLKAKNMDKGIVDRSINEIKEDVTFPMEDKVATTNTIGNYITTEAEYVRTDTLKTVATETPTVKQQTTIPPTTRKPTMKPSQQRRNTIDPMDQYLLEGILDIVDEKFNTINKRLMTLERGVNNLQYYNVRSFRVVNTHLHAVDTILRTMHSQVRQVEHENKVFEQTIGAMKDEVIDLQSMNSGMFQAIEQNLVHFHQDIEQKISAVSEQVETNNVHFIQLKNDTAEIQSGLKRFEHSQNDIAQNSETSVILSTEILQKSMSNANTTTDIYSYAETIKEMTRQINNTVGDIWKNVSVIFTDTSDIKHNIATVLTNISIANTEQDQYGSGESQNPDNSKYQEYRATNTHTQLSCGKLLELLDEKLKHINITLSEGQRKDNSCDTRITYPTDFKNQSRKLLRALATVNENVFQSVTLYKHTGNLIERVISDTELIASEQVRLRDELVTYLMNGTFDLFNQSIPDFAEFIATRNKDTEGKGNESETCAVTKSLLNEVLKLSFNGTQLMQLMTELATTSSSTINLSIDRLSQEITRLNKVREEAARSGPMYPQQETFIRDDPKAGENHQLSDIQNKTDRIYQLSEAIASNTGWIPYVFHNLRFVENQVNKTLKQVSNIGIWSEEIVIRQRANMAFMFIPKPTTTPSPKTTVPTVSPNRRQSEDISDQLEVNLPEPSKAILEENHVHCALINESSLIAQMIDYVYNTNVKINRLIPALTNLLGEPEPYISLVDGNTDREGRVEVYHKGQWGTIGGSLSHVEASYVCRKLGYLGGISAGSGHFGAGSGQFWNLNVTCLRTRWCSAVTHVTTSTKYNHLQDVGVICDHMLRLTQMNEDEEQEMARDTGKLEIYHQTYWMPICSKGWGREETSVACKQLGFHEGAADEVKDESLSDSHWMVNVTCKGSENRLDACVFESFEPNGCPDLKYVSIICS